MMQKNVGTWDALMRITFGLTGLAWSASRLAQRPVRLMTLMVAGLSAMKVAEGITRFCPMLFAMGISTRNTGPRHMNTLDRQEG